MTLFRPFVLCVVLSAALAAQQQKAAEPAPTKPEDLCTVEGQVTSVATGAPVRKAEITLHGTDRKAGVIPNSYSVTSDAGGNFTIKDVEPGKYALSAERTGFVTFEYGARHSNRGGGILSLDQGQRMKDLALRLTPQAVITGRITDENSEPIASAWVQAMRYSYRMGKRQLIPAGAGSTNDLGEYRIHGLAAGRYYLVARDSQDDGEASVDASAVPAAEGYVTTYYPDTMDAATAAAIEVAPGAQLRGMNLVLVKARTFRVRGRVEGRHDVNVSFIPRGQHGWMFMNGHEQGLDQKGNFEIRNVLPGAYTITASSWADQKALSARQDIDVGEENIDDIVLVLAHGFELNGQVEIEGGNTVNLDSVRVYLQPKDETHRVNNSMDGSVRGGAFTIADVAPDVYYPRVMGLPDGFWVKSIQMGDQDGKVAGLDLTHGAGSPVVIGIAPNAGQIDGAVTNDRQQPAPGAVVVLVPELKLREHPEAYKTVNTDQNGRFSLKNIDPGDYKLFAWADVEYGAYMDPDFLKPFEDRGRSITIQEGGHENAQLDLIPAESAAGTRPER